MVSFYYLTSAQTCPKWKFKINFKDLLYIEAICVILLMTWMDINWHGMHGTTFKLKSCQKTTKRALQELDSHTMVVLNSSSQWSIKYESSSPNMYMDGDVKMFLS